MENSILSEKFASSGPVIIQELESRLKSKIRENEQLKQLLSGKPAISQDFPAENEKKPEILQELQSLKGDFLGLRSKNEELVAKNQEFIEKNEELFEKNRGLQEKIHVLLGENAKLNEIVRELQRKLRENVENFEETREILAKTQQNQGNLRELQRENSEMREFIAELQRNIEEISRKYEKSLQIIEKCHETEEKCKENTEKLKEYESKFAKFADVLSENSKLLALCRENDANLLRNREENSLLSEKMLEFSAKIQEIEENYEKITANFVIVCAENERLHGLFSENGSFFVEKLEKERFLLENEVNRWKLEFENLRGVLQENQEISKENQQFSNLISNLYFEKNVEEEKYQRIVGELVEKIKVLSMENERLNEILINRCKDLMNNWGN